MRPGEKSGIVAEGSRDARYLILGARLVGNEKLANEVVRARADVRGELFKTARAMVSDSELRPQFRGVGQAPKRPTREEIAGKRVDQDLKLTDIPVHEAPPSEVEASLEAVASLGGLKRLRHGVTRFAAQQMIEGLNKPDNTTRPPTGN